MATGSVLGHHAVPLGAIDEVSEEVVESWLQVAASSGRGAERADALAKLVRAVESGVIRDLDYSQTFYRLVFQVGETAWSTVASDDLRTVYFFTSKLVNVPEFSTEDAASVLRPAWIRALCSRLTTPEAWEQDAVRTLLHWAYDKFVPMRKHIRRLLGDFFRNFLRTGGTRVAGLPTALRVLSCIVQGFSVPLNEAHLDLLHQVLLPLHEPHGFLTETFPVVGAYMEQLTYCILQFVKKDQSLLPSIVSSMVQSWPVGYNANTPKEILMVHSVEQLLEAADATGFAEALHAFQPMLTKCILSDNCRVAERALMFWKGTHVMQLYATCHRVFTPKLLKPLLRGCEKHWSATVNKMTYVVLGKLRELDPDFFQQCCVKALGADGPARVAAYMEVIKPEAAHELESEASLTAEAPTLLPGLKFHDLVFGYEDLGSGAFSTVRYAKHIDRMKPPSAWNEYAVKVIKTELIEQLGYESSVQREIAVLRKLSHPGIARLVASFRWRQGAFLVLEYAAKGDLHSQITKRGSLDLASTKFVAGEVVAALKSIHDLGFIYGDLKPENILLTKSGHSKLTDFGAVRPVSEAAIKYINESKDVVQTLPDGDYKVSTPAVAPVIAPREPEVTTRSSSGAAAPPVTITGVWPGAAPAAAPKAAPPVTITGVWPGSRTAGAGSGAPVIPKGRLMHSTTIVHAPAAPHTQRAPLAAVTETKSESESEAETSAAKRLRGDAAPVSNDDTMVDVLEEPQPTVEELTAGIEVPMPLPGEDNKQTEVGVSLQSKATGDHLEGTAAYLAPELVRGSMPSMASDAWALGCVVYFCLAGRPPVWAESQPEMLAQIVSFNCERSFPDGFPEEAKGLVTGLMDPNPETRLGANGMDEIAAHPFFSGLDVFRLYSQSAPELESGSAAPQAEAGWTRRQMSVMFTPMPTKFNFSDKTYSMGNIAETAAEAQQRFGGTATTDAVESLRGTAIAESGPVVVL